jgi:Na+/H+ antiporter NhaD/arsenite permease-like protein
VSALDRARRFPEPAVRLGGNGTLICASANLTVAGIAERNGVPCRFVTYALYGM